MMFVMNVGCMTSPKTEVYNFNFVGCGFLLSENLKTMSDFDGGLGP